MDLSPSDWEPAQLKVKKFSLPHRESFGPLSLILSNIGWEVEHSHGGSRFGRCAVSSAYETCNLGLATQSAEP